MAEPTLLGDIIQPAWNSLTPEERTCWHFWALANPLIDELGVLRTLNGEQAHYQRNKDLAVTESVPLLTEPPADFTPPRPVAVITLTWPLASQLGGSISTRGGFVALELEDELPADTAAIVTQGYYRKKNGGGRPPRIRHVCVILPLATGQVNLQLPSGYYATTSGDNKFARIFGVTAQRRPDRPLATIKLVNVENGQTLRQIIANPYGGSRKKTNRPRATQVNPRPGNHYP